jgi:ATP-dependent Clp protease ATP-binding subunit ClpX
MLDLMYRIPSDESISRCVITKDIIEKNLTIEEEEFPKLEEKNSLAS